MSNLPLEKPAEGSKIESLAAMVKGFLPQISLNDFPVEPEKACEKLPLFLPCWLKRFGKISKPDSRAAFRIAAPKLGTAERDTIIDNLNSHRKFLLKKPSGTIFPQIAGNKASDGYKTAGANFFPQIAWNKASDGYNTTGAIFCHRLQGPEPVIATIVLVPFFATDCTG